MWFERTTNATQFLVPPRGFRLSGWWGHLMKNGGTPLDVGQLVTCDLLVSSPDLLENETLATLVFDTSNTGNPNPGLWAPLGAPKILEAGKVFRCLATLTGGALPGTTQLITQALML
jgi:hypothetical protein